MNLPNFPLILLSKFPIKKAPLSHKIALFIVPAFFENCQSQTYSINSRVFAFFTRNERTYSRGFQVKPLASTVKSSPFLALAASGESAVESDGVRLKNQAHLDNVGVVYSGKSIEREVS